MSDRPLTVAEIRAAVLDHRIAESIVNLRCDASGRVVEVEDADHALPVSTVLSALDKVPGDATISITATGELHWMPAAPEPDPAPDQPADIEIRRGAGCGEVTVYVGIRFHCCVDPDALAGVVQNLLAKLDAKHCISIDCGTDRHIARLVWGIAKNWPHRALWYGAPTHQSCKYTIISIGGEKLSYYPRGEDDAT